jgi:hypothetical protein
MKIWLIVSSVPHVLHLGCFSAAMMYPCVNLVCPMRSLFIITSNTDWVKFQCIIN